MIPSRDWPPPLVVAFGAIFALAGIALAVSGVVALARHSGHGSNAVQIFGGVVFFIVGGVILAQGMWRIRHGDR